MSARPSDSIIDARTRLESAVENYWSVIDKLLVLLNDETPDTSTSDCHEMEEES